MNTYNGSHTQITETKNIYSKLTLRRYIYSNEVAMIEVLITLVPSVLWIPYRCLKVLRTPAVVLTEQLHIDIPHAPTICIDSIAETSAIIHWDIETKDDEFLSYALSINNAIGKYSWCNIKFLI